MMKLLEKYTVYDKEGTQPHHKLKKKQNYIKQVQIYLQTGLMIILKKLMNFQVLKNFMMDWEEHCDDVGIDQRNRLSKTELEKRIY